MKSTGRSSRRPTFCRRATSRNLPAKSAALSAKARRSTGSCIGENAYIEHSILAENVVVGKDTKIGVGEEAENSFNPKVYAFGLATIGENSVIPAGVTIGKNTAVIGKTVADDYPNGALASGGVIFRENADAAEEVDA